MASTSIPARLAAVFTLAASCANRLQSIIDVLKHTRVPNEILALSNEVSDLRSVIAEVEVNHEIISRTTSIPGPEQAEHTNTRTSYQLERAHSKLMELDKLISSSVKLSHHKTQNLRKIIKLCNKDLSATVQGIREVKQNILLLVTSRTA